MQNIPSPPICALLTLWSICVILISDLNLILWPQISVSESLLFMFSTWSQIFFATSSITVFVSLPGSIEKKIRRLFLKWRKNLETKLHYQWILELQFLVQNYFHDKRLFHLVTQLLLAWFHQVPNYLCPWLYYEIQSVNQNLDTIEYLKFSFQTLGTSQNFSKLFKRSRRF